MPQLNRRDLLYNINTARDSPNCSLLRGAVNGNGYRHFYDPVVSKSRRHHSRQGVKNGTEDNGYLFTIGA